IFLVLLAKLRQLSVSRWHAFVGAMFKIITVIPLFCPRDKIRVIFDSLYGILDCFFDMASTHCARTKRLLLMLALSVILSLSLAVRRLSSLPARSIALMLA